MVEHPGDVYAAGVSVNPAQADLARALVALPGWEWRAGMTAIDKKGARWLVYFGRPAILCGQGIGHAGYVGGWESSAPIFLSPIPDLTDDATGGILLGMLPPDHMIDRCAGAATVTIRGHRPARPDLVYEHGGLNVWWSVNGATLGEAVAAALVAVGRCP